MPREKIKAGHGRRRIDLDNLTVSVLRAHQLQQSEELLRLGIGRSNDQLVFTTFDGRMINPSNFSGEFSKLVRKLSIPYINFHGLRHIHISHLLLDGHPIKVVSARAGHAWVTITLDRYGHLLPDSQEALADQFGEDLAAEMERVENTDR